MSKKIEIHKQRKVNRIYHRCLTSVLIACCLGAPWLMHSHFKIGNHRKSHNEKTKFAKSNEQPITLAEQNVEAKPVQNPLILAKKLEPLLNMATTYEPVQSTIPSVNLVGKIIDAIKESKNLPIVKDVINTAVHAKNLDFFIPNTKIDSKFLEKMEGVKLKGYVPAVKKSKSGVTIGTGFDLGQMGKNEFNSLPFDSSLKSKLAPYVGLKERNALAFLKKHPLSITSKELEEVDAAAAKKILKPLEEEYQKYSGKSFTSLPSEAQTAIFSYAYQYGPGFYKKASKLWHYFVAENWRQASTVLKSSKKYKSRRNQEAHLLDHMHKNA